MTPTTEPPTTEPPTTEPPTTEPLATISGLVVGPAGGDPIVDGVDLALHRGEVLGMAGPSGSGKTTVALALLGHVRPGLRLVAGAVRVAGHDPFAPQGARWIRGRVVAFLGQDPAAALNPRRRLGAQLGEAIRLRGAGRSTEELLAGVGLPTDRSFLRRYPWQVSGGQAQRVAFALVTAGRPDLLVLDEPTAGLDATGAAVLRELIAAHAREQAVVLVSHDRHLLAALAPHCLLLRAGRVVETGPPRAVLPAAALRPNPAPGPGPSVLRADRLRARHGRTRVLHEVSLSVSAGECLALVGPSGSGKSTTAACLLGLHRPDDGVVLLDDSTPLATRAARRTREQRRAIQLVAQNSVDALNPHETVAAALARPMRHLRGLSPAAADAEVGRLLDRVRLPREIGARRPLSLSGGERQRVNLARALAAAPRVLICDEITSALDPDVAAAVLDLIAELRRDLGLAVVLITHDAEVVARAAHRVITLDAGRVVTTHESGAAAPSRPAVACSVAVTSPGTEEPSWHPS